MHGFANRFSRMAPVAASVSAPLVFLEPREERRAPFHRGRRGWPVLCDDLSIATNTSQPRHLMTSVNSLYKNAGIGGFSDRYEIVGEIGSGSFGTVYKSRIKDTNKFRAVKRLDKSKIDVETIRNEINALLNLDHPHICKLIRYYDEEKEICLIFELCTGPDLFDAIVESMDSPQGRMNERDVQIALRHMLKALQCCHGHYVGHYDVKPENFMYRSSERTNLKMIDLGMSSGFALKSKTLKGTFEYMAPEVFRGIYGPEADVWSCGVVLFVMLTGVPFFPTKEAKEMEELVNDRRWVQERVKWATTRGISPNAHNMLKEMLIHDRHMRITVPEALKHPFIQKSYSQALHDTHLRIEARQVLEGLQDSFRKFSALPMLTRAAFAITAHLVATSSDEMTAHRIAFRMVDRLGHGELSVDALEGALKMHKVKVDDDLNEIFKLVDTDGDGYISSMDIQAASLPPSVFREDSNWKAAFRFFDKNGDGFIDADDLIAALAYKTEADKKMCERALREVSPAPHRISFQDFLAIVRNRPVGGESLPGRGFYCPT